MQKNYQLAFTSRECVDLIKKQIKEARESIDLELYYFIEDEIGTEILDLLIEKAGLGLKIRLLVDSVGSYDLSKSDILQRLKTSGINVRFFNSLFPLSKNRKTFFFLRNHRRTVIIDDEFLFTGGVCIGKPTIDWPELGIFIKDEPATRSAKKVFNKTWSKVYHPTFKIGSVSNNKDSAITLTVNDFSYLTQSPLQFQRHIYKHYLKLINDSKESIYLIAPYFIPDKRLVRYLKRAAKRHVNVNIIVPSKTDWLIADLARNTYIKTLLKNNIKIHFYTKLIHSKFAMFDNEESFIGTMNLDNLSLRYNYECGLVVKNKNCIGDLLKYIHEDLLKNSTPINIISWKERGLFVKIIEKIVWIFRKFL